MVYLDTKCYNLFRKNKEFLNYFDVIFLEFKKENFKICQSHNEFMRNLSEKFYRSVRKKTLLMTKENKTKFEKSVYAIFINLLYEQVQQCNCLEGTEYCLAYLPDWRKNQKILRKRECFDLVYTEYFNDKSSYNFNKIKIYIDNRDKL